jgi:hypothetical protein
MQEKTKVIIKDPDWDAELEMGPEGLIATIDDPKELIEALRKNILQTKEKVRP